MSRSAIVTQAEVARSIRAARVAGLTVVRVVVRSDGVAIETADATEVGSRPLEPVKEVVL